MHLNNTDHHHYLHVYVYSNFNTIDMLNMKVKFEIFRLVFPSHFSKKSHQKTNKQTKILITFYQTHGHPHFLSSLHWQVITSNTFFVLCSFVDGHIGGRRFEGWKKNLPRGKRRKKIKVLLNKLCIHQCVHTISVNCNQYKTKMNIKKWFTHKI